MSMREVPRPEWGEFLDGFTGQHQRWLVTVEVEEGGERRELLESEPLEGIAEAPNDLIEVRAGGHTIRVPHPTRILVEEEGDGAHRGLHIDTHDGSHAEIRFRSPVRPEFVNGL